MLGVLPPYISTGDPRSFAERTITERKPAIIAQVVRENSLHGPDAEPFLGLLREIREGMVTDPFETYRFDPQSFEQPELAAWFRQIRAHVGKPWRRLPWYFAESVFYLKLLLAFGYYDPSSRLHGIDPFQQSKDRELMVDGGGRDIAEAILQTYGISDPRLRVLSSLVLFSLWGNRIDLSNFYGESLRNRVIAQDRHNLLVDDVDRLVDCLDRAERIDIILDNCGAELACDLLVCNFLLTSRGSCGRGKRVKVRLHVKRAPFFVSDAMSKDVHQTIDVFRQAADSSLARVGVNLVRSIEEGQLTVSDHPFWNGPLHFAEMPQDICDLLSDSHINVFKGDANYRRVLSDRKWDPCTRLSDIAAYLPAAFGSLRTMKSEIVVGLSRRQVEHLNSTQPDWMVSGELGIAALVERSS